MIIKRLSTRNCSKNNFKTDKRTSPFGGRPFSLLLALLMIVSHLPLSQAFAAQDGMQAPVSLDGAADVLYADSDGELTELQELALYEIGRERLNRGLIGFEDAYALSDDDDLVSVIVMFEHSPSEVQVLVAEREGVQLSRAAAEEIVEDDHALFRQELSTLFESQQAQTYTIEWEYRVALNGVSLTLPAHLVSALADFESVRAIYPNAMMSHGPVEVESLESVLRNPQGMAPGRRTMRADDMHALGYRGAGVVIAVLDTGIDYDHPAFEGAFLTFEEMRERNPALTEEETINGYFFGRNFINDVALFPTMANPQDAPAANDPMETTYEFWRGTGLPRFSNPLTGEGQFFTAHGTHVAGTIAGRDTGADVAILGVAPEATLIAYRVLGPRGSGPIAGIVAAIEQAVHDRVDIVNMSLGGANNTPAGWAPTTAVNHVKLTNPDISFVISAGNSGSNFHTVGSPGTASTAITVSNIVEGGYTGVMMDHEGEAYAINFGSTPASLWVYDPALGKIINTWEGLEHEDGVYRLFALPRTDETNQAPGPVPGVGVQADFDALVAKYGIDALQGAFVLIRRGHTFVDVAATAYELGLGGVIVINNTDANDVAGIPTLPLPYVFVALDRGIVLYEQMQGAIAADEPSAISFSSLLMSSFRLSPTSSRGPIAQSYEIKPDIGANGTSVFSAVPAWWVGAGGGSDYRIAYANMSGTSMSAPHVAGAVALMIEYSREHTGEAWENEVLKTRIMNTAIPFESGLYSVFDKGIGYIDVYAATHAQTVVFVEYDRVATAAGVPFASQNFQTMRTGSFSFGGANAHNGLDRTLTGSIVNQGTQAQTYVITYAFIQGGRNIQDPAQATLSFSETTLTAPAGDTVYFEANFRIEPRSTAGFYEGIVTVATADGEIIARLPFGAVLSTPLLQDVYLYRPVISTSAYRQNPASSQLGIFYTPNHGFGVNTFVVRDVEGLDESNWFFDEFEAAFIGGRTMLGGGLGLGQPHRGLAFDQSFQGVTLEEEGDYFLVLEVFRQTTAAGGWVLEKDILLPFSVDNTPPVLTLDQLEDSSTLSVINPESGIAISGNVHDTWLEAAAERGLTFDIWRAGAPHGPMANQGLNGLWMQVEDENPVRVSLDHNGNFDIQLETDAALPLDVTFFAIDNYTIIPRVDAMLGTTNQGSVLGWLADDDFLLPTRMVNADLGLNAYLRIGRLFNFTGAVLSENVWTGSNMIEKTVTLVEQRVPVTLETPISLSITDDVLTWDSVANASAYRIYINGISETDVLEAYVDLTTLTIPYGTHTVAVRAIGDGEYLLDSALSEAIEFTVYRIIWGDVNGDGVVNLNDLVLLNRYLANHDLSGITFYRHLADVYHDGVINADDRTLLQRYLAGHHVVLGPQ
ncbi:MAG: S8 family serine peptidase [Defluviitaleaceae bacterium]|nr:S8 family serine peptidase [Defluviitaleaceae bacterium]